MSRASEALRRALETSVAEGLCPGAACAVLSTRTGDAARACVGTLDGEAPVTPATRYDLASLTKLLCTAVLAADEVARGALRLDETPWPRWPGVSVEHVLRHEGGLPAHRPFFEAFSPREVDCGESRAGIVAAALATPLDDLPGARTRYSDIGFIALGALIEARRGASLDTLWEAHPISRGTRARFIAHASAPSRDHAATVAPTERCPWRGRVVRGAVHDENAWGMGGVAGHAGLFGDLDDASLLARRLMARARDPEDALHRFAQRPARGRPLGFDLATPGGSTADVLSANTVGHLGFTGTSLWLDLDDEVAYVLLSNTVFYGRSDVASRNRALRQRFHRAAKGIL